MVTPGYAAMKSLWNTSCQATEAGSSSWSRYVILPVIDGLAAAAVGAAPAGVGAAAGAAGLGVAAAPAAAAAVVGAGGADVAAGATAGVDGLQAAATKVAPVIP